MCHNIIDGRFHSICGHFIGMSTRLQDCNKPDCLFSRRHEHPIGCKSNQCKRTMLPPVHNPIRLSGQLCGHCIICNPPSHGS